MEKLTTGILIALVALVMSGSFSRDVMAGEISPRAVGAQAHPSQTPVVNGTRSGLVVSLVLTLEALRTAPAVLDQRKV